MSDPVTPVTTDPTNDKLYAIVSAAVTGLTIVILAFTHFTTEQKTALMSASGVVGSLIAYIFSNSHKANVQAVAHKQATMAAARLVRGVPILLVASMMALFSAGCANVLPGSDPVVVNTQRTTKATLDAVDSFVQYDHANLSMMKQNFPQIHAFAQTVRRVYPTLYRNTWIALDLYKTSKTQQNADAVSAALNDVTAVLNAVLQAWASLHQTPPADRPPTAPMPGVPPNTQP